MTSLTQFGLIESEIVLRNGTYYLTISKIAEVLGVSRQNIYQLIRRNKEDFSEVVNLKLTDQEALLLDEEQVYLLCMLMRKSGKAKEFRRVFARALKMIRSREFVHISELKAVQLELGFTQEKLIGKQQRISKNRIDRFHHLRAVGLTQKEASRAVRIPFRSAVKLEKAKKLITNSTVLLTAGKEVLNDN